MGPISRQEHRVMVNASVTRAMRLMSLPYRWLFILVALPSLACSPGISPNLFGAYSSAANVPIAVIQGAGHRSPLEHQRVVTTGVVTAVGEQRWWIEDPVGDEDSATSEGLCLMTSAAAFKGAVGQTVWAKGKVEEIQEREVDLPVTCLVDVELRILEPSAALPAAVVLGTGGRKIPSEVADDDAFDHFDPGVDGIDFFESLEGMRVSITEARVVGATSRRGQLAVVADGGRGATLLTRRGGLLRREGDANPEALQIDGGLGVESPRVDLGHRFSQLEAVVDYDWGAYRLRLTAAPEVDGSSVAAERTSLLRDAEHLTVASFNVLNLAATDGDEKFRRLAELVVNALGSPDILALQEVQDDTGGVDDGVTTAEATFSRLIDAISSAGGPVYGYRQIDPADGTDGGRPGGNIRLGFLFDPSRVEAVDAPAPSPGASASYRAAMPIVRREKGELQLVPSPARLEHEAFERDRERGRSGTRKPLLGQFRFRGRDLIVVDLHFRSKGADDPAFGQLQPPRRHSEAQRAEQAAVVRNWVEGVLAVEPEAWIIVAGDLNEHIERPPVRILAGSDLINLMAQVPEEERYSYVFQGSAQVLDHFLVSRAIASQASPEVDIVHACADYNSEAQASDHDPLVLRLHVP